MEDVAGLLNYVPAQYLFWCALALKLVIAIPGAASWAALAIKGLGGAQSGAAKVADKVAINTRKVADSELIATLNKRLGELETAHFARGQALTASNASIARQEAIIAGHEQTIRDQAAVISNSVQLVKP